MESKELGRTYEPAKQTKGKDCLKTNTNNGPLDSEQMSQY